MHRYFFPWLPEDSEKGSDRLKDISDRTVIKHRHMKHEIRATRYKQRKKWTGMILAGVVVSLFLAKVDLEKKMEGLI